MYLNDIQINKFLCVICNKVYSSRASLYNHNKRFHNDNNNNNNNNKYLYSQQETIQITEIVSKKKSVKCEYCNKFFSSRQTKYEHKKKACKFNNINNNGINNNIDNNTKSNNKLKELEHKINELQKIIINTNKNITNINKQNNIINNNTTNINNNIINNNNNNIHNKYINFYKYINYKKLSDEEILNILNKKSYSLEESVKTFHFNHKFPEFNNIFITNLKENTAYIFDGYKFIAVSKCDALNDLINTHINAIKKSSQAYKITKQMDPTDVDILKTFISTITNETIKYNPRKIKII